MISDKIFLSKVIYFYYVARLGSFSRAAEHFKYSQSALSRIVQDLEHLLKKQLFIRHARGVKLTVEGKIVFEAIQKIMDQIESLKISLIEDTILPKGELKLATTKSLASLWLPYHLTDFLQAYPDITLRIEDTEPDLNTREAEAILGLYLPHQPEYVQRYLTSLHFQLYASPGYIEKFGLPRTFKDLDQHRLLIRGTKEAAFCDDWVLNKNQINKKPRQPYLILNSEYGLYESALADFGLVVLAKEYPCVEQSGLIPVLPDIKGPSVELYYIYHQHQAQSRRVTALADYLEKKFQREEMKPS